MELAANVWPVVDARTGLILRYFVRAYAIEGPDAVIRATLRALAATDCRMARMFRIPENFKVASEHGILNGCITIAGFHHHQAPILERAFSELEDSFAPVQGIAQSDIDPEPIGFAISPTFPKEPYLVVTTLVETTDGQLLPQTGA
ncbi:MAG: hypothetical protein HYY09_04075 [Firmicutes bacterium]|nr:hypothetical protein [Bacillota bacterium]